MPPPERARIIGAACGGGEEDQEEMVEMNRSRIACGMGALFLLAMAAAAHAETTVEGNDVVLQRLTRVRVGVQFEEQTIIRQHDEAARLMGQAISRSLPDGIVVVDDPAAPLLRCTLSMLMLPGGTISSMISLELIDAVRLERIPDPIWLLIWKCHTMRIHRPDTSTEDSSAGDTMAVREVVGEFSARWGAKNPD